MPRFKIGRRRGGYGVSGEALVLTSDAGFSALNWWTPTASLHVTVPGRKAFYAESRCRVHRDKGLIAGVVLPVTVSSDDPPRVAVRWDEVPTIQQRIANRDPAILDPEGTWRTLAAARAASVSVSPPRLASGVAVEPPWRSGRIEGWPSVERLADGRRPGIALVVSRSGDPGGYRSGDDWHLPHQPYGGTIYDGIHDYLGWLLLCVVPESGSRYGVHIRLRLRRGHLGPVLPVAVHPEKPHDVEIPWRYAPDMVRAAVGRLRAANSSAVETLNSWSADRGAAAGAALAGIADPVEHANTEEMLRRLGMAPDGAVAPGRMAGSAPTPTNAASGASPSQSGDASLLARLQRLHAAGILTDDEYRAECEKLGSGSGTE
ncbi:MAG: SHOCT domain-containing protein [Solirubrobacteraceae bacterium]